MCLNIHAFGDKLHYYSVWSDSPTTSYTVETKIVTVLAVIRRLNIYLNCYLPLGGREQQKQKKFKARMSTETTHSWYIALIRSSGRI